MPKVVYTPLIDGAIPTGEAIFDSFYSLDGAGVPPSSLAVTNGFLDAENLDIKTREVDYTLIQKSACSGGEMIAGTCSLDYFSPVAAPSAPGIGGFFGGVGDTETAEGGYFKAIPGASIQFYLPYKAFVLLTWQVCWTNDSADDDHESHIRLFVDGQRAGASGSRKEFCNVRRVRRTMYAADPDSTAVGADKSKYKFLRDRYKGRYWSGHQWLPLPGDTALGKGFHSASLRVIQNTNIPQTRVRARSMKVIFFKAFDD